MGHRTSPNTKTCDELQLPLHAQHIAHDTVVLQEVAPGTNCKGKGGWLQ